MKPKYYIAGISALFLAAPAHANVTVNVTGATAFRSATILAIKKRFDVVKKYKFGHNTAAGTLSGTAPNSSTLIFSGTYPGITGTTTIRCNFSGSVEGIRALVDGTPGYPADPTPPMYYVPSVLSGTGVAGTGAYANVIEYAAISTSGGNVETAPSTIAFSDVSVASTPYAGLPLQPASPAAGVIVFTMVANDGAKVTNVTSQQFRALMSKGYQPLSLFTGVSNDNPKSATPSANARWVFGTGRNDGSGTRAVYLGETGYGITNKVNQYVVTNKASDEINSIQFVPMGGVTPLPLPSPLPPNTSVLNNTAYASNTWGQDDNGNGGYSSGGTLAGDLGNKGDSITVLDNLGNLVFPSPVKADLVSMISVNDALTVKNAGGVICSFNGVKLGSLSSLTATGLANSDVLRVVSGTYSAWSYEYMYLRNDVAPGSPELAVYNSLKSTIPSTLAAAGINLAAMKSGRSEDFGTIVVP